VVRQGGAGTCRRARALSRFTQHRRTNAVARYAHTQHAIEKGLDQVAAEAGITLLDDWIEQLKGADEPGVAGVAKDLARLKAELGKGAPKADAVLKLVLKPGVAATRLADAAEGTKGEKLRTLGEALTNAGQAHDAEGGEANGRA